MNLPCLVSTTVKTEKTETKYQDWLNALTYLYPNKILCPNSLQCFDDCLKASGRLTMNKKKMIARTKLFYQDFDVFFSILLGELHKVHQKAKKKNKKFAYRPNGTSDSAKIVKKLLSLPKHKQPFDVLYDYTKVPQRVIEYMNDDSYHLTFSYDGTNDKWASYFLKNKVCNVSVVFDVKRGEPLPTHHIIGGNVYQVIDGDLDDLRHKDIEQVIIGLRAKGKATKNIDKGGSFVQKPIKLLSETYY